MSSWIRLGEGSLFCLLEEVEACCKDEDGKVYSKDWVEDGREFRLEVTATFKWAREVYSLLG